MSDSDQSNGFTSDTEEINPRAHRRLVDNVARLHSAKQTRKSSRTEPAIKRSEFHLAKTTTDDAKVQRDTKVAVSDLVNVLNKASKNSAIGTTLKRAEAKKQVLNKPLEKPAAERLKRAINYEKTKEQLLRWEAIVARNRSSDHMVCIIRTTTFSAVHL